MLTVACPPAGPEARSVVIRAVVASYSEVNTRVMKPFEDTAVAAVFEDCPPKVRKRLMSLRQLIFETAAATDGVGELEETLKWGEPAYVTSKSRSGTTVRIGWKKKQPSRYAMYFHCQTNLVKTFRQRFLTEFEYEGNRAILFDVAAPVPRNSLTLCIAAALTYHRKRLSPVARLHGA